MGTADWTNTHVSRLLNEGTGNCFALASLYKILADRVGAEAELCTAPGHIYIRHADEHGNLHNVELGGRNFPGMGSIEAVTYTTPDAVKSGIALRALSKQQQVALALVYMAKGREYRLGADAGFVLVCAATALQYDSLNLNAMLLKAEAMETALLAGGETIEELRGTEQYKEYEQWLGHIYSLGYREMPLQMKNLLVQGWTRDTITKLAEVQYTQAEKTAENTGGDIRYGSSSWGLFNEDIRTQTTERIGRSIYNTRTNSIDGFTTDEQLYNHYNFDPVVFAWNMDPVVLVGTNPYNVFKDNPVLYNDPFGDYSRLGAWWRNIAWGGSGIELVRKGEWGVGYGQSEFSNETGRIEFTFHLQTKGDKALGAQEMISDRFAEIYRNEILGRDYIEKDVDVYLQLDRPLTKKERINAIFNHVSLAASINSAPQIMATKANVAIDEINHSGSQQIAGAVKELNNSSSTVIHMNPFELLATHSLTLTKSKMMDLKNKIKTNGITESVKFVEHAGNKYIVDGHHRARIAKELGIDQIPTQQVYLPYGNYKTVADLQYTQY